MNIAILGYGTVGKGVEKVAEENGIQVRYILMRDIDELTKPTMTRSLDEILSSPEVDCVIECIGGDEPSFTFVKKALESGKDAISSNKKMIVKHFDELIRIANEKNVRFLFSSACGGAIPWLPELSRIAGTDTLFFFAGIMNGTSNYILNKMYSENLSFADALSGAQALGYAEFDPSDDIDGIDTANKTILSMGIGFRKSLKLENLFVKGIRAFGLPEIRFAKERGYRCILLGRGSETTASVMPVFVKENSVFYGVTDNYNCFALSAKNFGPFAMIGQGAGSLPTASNVIRDIRLLNDPYPVTLKEELLPDYDSEKHVFYLRKEESLKSDLIETELGGNAYITKPISINELKPILQENDFIGELVND